MSTHNLEMLEEIFKGAKMGMNATKLVMDKTKDTDLKNKLTGQYGSFSKTAQKAEEMLISNNKIPEESGMMEKAMLWSSVQLNSMLDTDASHIAEMVINGSTMSIVSMTKKLNELPEASPEVRTLAKDFIHDQEHYIGEMKSFLC